MHTSIVIVGGDPRRNTLLALGQAAAFHAAILEAMELLSQERCVILHQLLLGAAINSVNAWNRVIYQLDEEIGVFLVKLTSSDAAAWNLEEDSIFVQITLLVIDGCDWLVELLHLFLLDALINSEMA